MLCIWYIRTVQSCICLWVFFFQAEDGIRDLVRSRGLGDVYKRQVELLSSHESGIGGFKEIIFEVRGRGAYSRLKYELSLIHI